MADNQYPIRCGHCDQFFWSYNISATVCNDCFSYGCRGNCGDCWKRKGVADQKEGENDGAQTRES